MTIQIVDTKGLQDLRPDGECIAPMPLIDAGQVSALLLNLAEGQSVGPCQMSVTVLYYVLEGQGHLRVDDEQADLETGSLVIVPPSAVRAISAAGQMRVPVVQAR